MIINLTPDPVHIYRPGTPDTLPADTSIIPTFTIPTCGFVARVEEEVIPAIGGIDRFPGASGALTLNGLPAPVNVAFGSVGGLPAPKARVWYVVSLVVALAKSDRADLLIPYDLVRNEQGTVIGCRRLARPMGSRDLNYVS